GFRGCGTCIRGMWSWGGAGRWWWILGRGESRLIVGTASRAVSESLASPSFPSSTARAQLVNHHQKVRSAVDNKGQQSTGNSMAQSPFSLLIHDALYNRKKVRDSCFSSNP